MTENAKSIAPSGRLRVTINVGNPILASRDATSGEPIGVSVELARLLADRIEVPLELVVLESAGAAVAAVEEGRADLGFFARDPDRAGLIEFTEPYVLIEGCYLVRDASTVRQISEVDSKGTRLVVGKGSAYDLFLSRAIKHATIERSPTSPAVVETFLSTGADVAAGVRQQLEADAGRTEGLRLLPGRFMVIEQAMGISRGLGMQASQALGRFVESVKADGSVARLLKKYGHEKTLAAPPSSSGVDTTN